MFGVFRPRLTPYASGRVGAGRSHVCTFAVRLASTMARLIPYTCLLAFLVYRVSYGFMYGVVRYGDMHGVAYNILVFRRPVALLLLVCVFLAPLFVVLPACAARHATYLCGFLFDHIFSCFACYGAVVLPMQVGLQCLV